MKNTLHILLALFCINLCSAQDALDQGHGIVDGKWVNIYVGNPDLAGVFILQNPIEHHTGISYKGKHPFVISFVMWNGSVNETYYTPEGKIISAGWWKLKDSGLDKKDFWRDVNFSVGSDPKFKSHRDPRS